MVLQSMLVFCAGLALATATSSGFEAATQDLPTVEVESRDLGAGPYYGDLMGRLDDPQAIGITGDVFIVNDTCLQILNFTYGAQAPDLYFWADRSTSLSSSGVRLSSFEFGDAALGSYANARVVVTFPDHVKLSDFRSFGLWCQAFAKNFGSVVLPADLEPPKADFLDGVIEGKRYGVGSGPILVMDRKTLKVYGFTFKGQNAPDGYFYVGRGRKPKHSDGVKVPIRGRDRKDDIRAMKENYNGKEDLILDLPEGYDIYNIDWLSVYCEQFRVDFGHIKVRELSQRLPPFVPPQSSPAPSEMAEAWPATTLLGRRESRRNFTFHLGPPGGLRGYEALARAKPNEYVWYVNGYMTPEIWLQRGVTYTFNVEGGDDASTEQFYNPLYISNEPFGGFMKLTPDEKAQVKTFAGVQNGEALMLPGQMSAGRLCVWTDSERGSDPDALADFPAFRRQLQLSCRPGASGRLTFAPDESTPDTVYYQSFTHYNMGWKMMVVDEIPAGLPDFAEEPFSTQIWLDNNLVTNVPRQPSLYSAAAAAAAPSLLLLLPLTALLTR